MGFDWREYLTLALVLARSDEVVSLTQKAFRTIRAAEEIVTLLGD